MKPTPHPTRTGFTMVELLIVISVIAIMASAFVNSVAMHFRGVAKLEAAPWHVVAALAVLLHFEAQPRPLFLTWFIQAEALLGLAILLRSQPLRVVSHAVFITTGIALMYVGQVGSFWPYILYGTAAIANTVLCRLVRAEEAVGPGEPLVWHIPLAACAISVFLDHPWIMCLALIVLIWRVGPWTLGTRALRHILWTLRLGRLYWTSHGGRLGPLDDQERQSLQPPLFLAPCALAAVLMVRLLPPP